MAKIEQPKLPSAETKLVSDQAIDRDGSLERTIDRGFTAREIKSLLRATVLGGCLALFFTFTRQSEPESGFILGYSLARITLGALTLALTVISGFILAKMNPLKLRKLNLWLLVDDRAWRVWLLLTGFTCFSLWCFVFSWLFIPRNMRPQILWGFFICGFSLSLIIRAYPAAIRAYMGRLDIFPKISSLSIRQKQVFLTLIVLSLFYIMILMPSNLNGTENAEAFRRYGGDEYVIYPILMDVMKTGDSFSASLYHFFIYEDYHYGFPFYFWSSLVLLPSKWFFRDQFAAQVQVNLPLLRIFVSVVPMVLSAMLIVFLFTRWRNFLTAIALFVFLLFAPGALQNNQGFWHPDGLNLLFVCLTIYYLQRDRFRFGKNFLTSAVFCGLSAATRLYGFFFALSIAVYLLLGFFRKYLSSKRLVILGGAYILLMAGVILFADPFLFRSDARANMMAILSEKSLEMTEGYEGDYDPRQDYRPGWDAWRPAFEDHYVMMFCFFYLLASLIFGLFRGNERLTHLIVLCWLIMAGGYLIFFVAVKSTQYVLPVLIPMMGAIFSVPLTLDSGENVPPVCKGKIARKISWILAWGILIVQFGINLVKITPRFR